MNNEARERETDRWPRDQGSPAKILKGCDIADDPSFIKEQPIDIRGAWRSVYHCNCWWVVGHHMMMYPCTSEREADRLLNRLQEDWDET